MDAAAHFVMYLVRMVTAHWHFAHWMLVHVNIGSGVITVQPFLLLGTNAAKGGSFHVTCFC